MAMQAELGKNRFVCKTSDQPTKPINWNSWHEFMAGDDRANLVEHEHLKSAKQVMIAECNTRVPSP